MRVRFGAPARKAFRTPHNKFFRPRGRNCVIFEAVTLKGLNYQVEVIPIHPDLTLASISDSMSFPSTPNPEALSMVSHQDDPRVNNGGTQTTDSLRGKLRRKLLVENSLLVISRGWRSGSL